MMLIRLRGCVGWSAPLLFSSTSTLILPSAYQHRGQVTPRISRFRPIVLVPITVVADIVNFLVEGVAPSLSSFASSTKLFSSGKRVCNFFPIYQTMRRLFLNEDIKVFSITMISQWVSW